jgi:hypothetical protein
MHCNAVMKYGRRETFDIHATSEQSSFLHKNEREAEKILLREENRRFKRRFKRDSPLDDFPSRHCNNHKH